MPDHLTKLFDATSVVPAINQIEVHPYFRQSELLDVNAQQGIISQAWAPIGGITFYRDGKHTSTLEDPVIKEIADAYGKTWRRRCSAGICSRQVIPKSVTPSRIVENFDVFDFDLSGRPARRDRCTRHRRPRRPEP